MKHLLLVFVMITASVITCAAQTVTRIEAQPEQLQMRAGESADLVILTFDQDGRAISTPLRISGARGALHFAKFYLMSRGLSQIQAERLVVLGFLGEVLSKLPLGGVVEKVTRVIAEKLSQH